MAKGKSVRCCKVCGAELTPPRVWYCEEHAANAHKEARRRAEKRSYQRRKVASDEKKQQEVEFRPGTTVLPPVGPEPLTRRKRRTYTNDLDGDVCRLEDFNTERREKGLPPLSYGMWRAMLEGRVRR